MNCKTLILSLLFLITFCISKAQRQPYLNYLKLDLSKGGIQADISDLVPYSNMKIGGVGVTVDKLPKGVTNRPEVGIAFSEVVKNIQVIHRWPQPDTNMGKIKMQLSGDLIANPVTYVDVPRIIITPGGDYLLTLIAGKNHYARVSTQVKVNDIFIYRSKNRGKTWEGPYLSTDIPYNQHAWVPIVPKGSKRIYMFSTEPKEGDFNSHENAGIGYRYSSDDGHTWSVVQRINPLNDPGYQGMWCINATETAKGTWLIAPHAGNWNDKPLSTRLSILRSEDNGKSWTLVPGARPQGWFWPGSNRMDEGRPLSLKDGRLVFFSRTTEGHIFRSESTDDGKTWSDFKPTGLVHPDAPPMISTLSDGNTIVALHHNRHSGGAFNREDRSELWISLSKDAGLTWSEPRFLAVTSTTTSRPIFGSIQYVLCYSDILADKGVLHFFIPHLWRQVIHVTIDEKDIPKLPTKMDLFPNQQ